jgi:hypothetical protein
MKLETALSIVTVVIGLVGLYLAYVELQIERQRSGVA